MPELDELREQINRIDEQIMDLYQQRMAVVRDIGAFKRENGLPLCDPTREHAKIAEAMDAVPDDLREHAASLMSLLMETSRALQRDAIENETSQDAG